jgi:hypothetical protein
LGEFKMTAIRQRILHAANIEAQSLTGQIDDLKLQLKEKQAELEAIDKKLKAATLASERYKAFVPTVGARCFCPRCAIYGRVSELSPRGDDTMECDICGLAI